MTRHNSTLVDWLRAIIADPQDTSRMLMFADWLQEQYDYRADMVRESVNNPVDGELVHRQVLSHFKVYWSDGGDKDLSGWVHKIKVAGFSEGGTLYVVFPNEYPDAWNRYLLIQTEEP